MSTVGKTLILSIPFTFLALIPLPAHADHGLVAIEGVVRDSASGEPLPTANIRVLQTTGGTAANAEGKYLLRLPLGRHTVVFSQIGYVSDTADVVLMEQGMTLDAFLRPTVIEVSEVVVYGGVRDPAEEVIRKAIAMKKNSLAGLTSYQFKAYTKTTLRILAEATDSSIAGVLETLSDGYWKSPDHYKEVISSRKQSANISPEQNILSSGRIPNLNDDAVAMAEYSIPGPTAPDAFDYYSFAMLDTLRIDRTRVYRIRVTPKSENIPLFDGTICIADRSFLVMQVDVGGNAAVSSAIIQGLRIRQDFSSYEDRYWLPIQTLTEFTARIAIFPPIACSQACVMYDYHINQDIQDSLFDDYLVNALPTADVPDTDLWNSAVVLPLTIEETQAYARLDSMTTHASLFARTLGFLFRLPITLRRVPLASLPEFFHFNRVEGAYVGGGVEGLKATPSTLLSLSAGYGLADHRWKYSGEIEQFLPSTKKVSLGGEMHRRVQFREEGISFSPGIITWLALFEKSDPVDYFLADGWSVYGRTKPITDLKVEIRYLDELHGSVRKNTDFGLIDTPVLYRENPPILDGHLRSVRFLAAYDNRRFIDVGFSREADESQDAVVAFVENEFSDVRKLGSDFSFNRCTGGLRWYHHGLGSKTLRVSVRFGCATGALPPQRLFDLAAASEGIAPDGGFKTAFVKEFAGDRFASLQVEYSLGNSLFRLLDAPIIRNLDLALYSGTGWTEMSPKSKQIQPLATASTRSLFQEVGFGIDRILTVLRLDFTWRLTHRRDVNFAVTLGSVLF